MNSSKQPRGLILCAPQGPVIFVVVVFIAGGPRLAACSLLLLSYFLSLESITSSCPATHYSPLAPGGVGSEKRNKKAKRQARFFFFPLEPEPRPFKDPSLAISLSLSISLSPALSFFLILSRPPSPLSPSFPISSLLGFQPFLCAQSYASMFSSYDHISSSPSHQMPS